MLLKAKWFWCLLVAPIIGVAVWYFSSRGESPREVALKVDSALQKGDAEVLWKYIGSEEKKTYQVTQAEFKTFLDDYYVPSFQGLGQPEVKMLDADQLGDSAIEGQFQVARSYHNSDGVIVGTGATVLPSKDGPMAVELLTRTLFSALRARHSRKSDQFSYDFIVRGLEADKAQLEKIGYTGAAIRDGGVNLFLSFDDYLILAKKRQRVLQDRQSSSE